MNSFKKRWNIKVNNQLIIILVVFALTGTSTVRVTRFVLDYFQIYAKDYSAWSFFVIKFVLMLFIYQILLVAIGTILGQFSFFWRFEQKMLSRIGLGFLFRSKKNKN